MHGHMMTSLPLYDVIDSRAKPGTSLVYYIKERCLSVCVSVCVSGVNVQTAHPIATKFGGGLEGHLGRNLRASAMTSLPDL